METLFTAFTAGKLVPSERDRLEPDCDGLYLIVRKTGRKTWLLRYWRDGKEKRLTLGDYPAVTLQQARRKRDEIKARVRSGMDAVDRGTGVTFADVADEWWRLKRPRLSEHYAGNVDYRLNHYILPAIGGIELSELKRTTATSFLYDLSRRGANETAKRCGEIVVSVMEFALERGYIEHHALNGITRIVPRHSAEHFTHVEEPSEFGELLNVIDNVQPVITRSALQIVALCFVRVGELLAARWDEINNDEALWVIPAEHTKRRREHVVPLSRQANEVFRELKEYELNTVYDRRDDTHNLYVFPTTKGNTPLTEAALLKMLRTLAANGAPRSTVHGFRHTASTLLHSLGENTLHIEKQLAHLDPNRIRAVYNKYEFLNERRAMLQRYADYLDTIKAEALTRN